MNQVRYNPPRGWNSSFVLSQGSSSWPSNITNESTSRELLQYHTARCPQLQLLAVQKERGVVRTWFSQSRLDGEWQELRNEQVNDFAIDIEALVDFALNTSSDLFLDLTAVEHISSLAVISLNRAEERLQEQGNHLFLFGAPTQFQTALSLAGNVKHYRDRSEALQAQREYRSI